MVGILCGPLLRYTYIDHDAEVWNGTVLVVLRGTDAHPPRLSIPDSGVDDSPKAVCLLSENGHTFWRWPLAVRLGDAEREVRYSVFAPESGGEDVGKKEEWERELDGEDDSAFWVPGKNDSMRIMFYSCNGYDTDANPDDFAGPVLWNDVLRIHEKKPFHVMIGGGDQVYSDGVRMEGGPLKAWGDELKPKKRAAVPCTPELEAEMETWYFDNYCKWYTSHEGMRNALARIPAVNIWDDHDIIDGFGSYKDKWMRAPVFMAVGRCAWKYYMLFQLQTPSKGEEREDPSWEIGQKTGPYVREKSRSICTTLGKRLVFYGLDCRTERTIRRVCYSEAYDAMFRRLEDEVGKAADTTHLILLLGVPIAYPRLVWAETLLSHRAVTPLRLMNRKLGLAGGFFNNFDGSAELLDDLNDHWCAGPHKRERNHFIRRLQDFAARKQIRVTILGGDVHLAAVGRFFTKEKMQIPQNKDPRYMLNVISSAITNAGPPVAVANVLDRRNKLHRLDAMTHENMMSLFEEDPNGTKNRMNQTTMPHRNYVIITEHAGLDGPDGLSDDRRLAADDKIAEEGGEPIAVADAGPRRADKYPEADEGKLAGKDAEAQLNAQDEEEPEEDMEPARRAKGGAGHASAAAPVSGTRRKYALDVAFRVEIDQHDQSGMTRAYGFVVPALET